MKHSEVLFLWKKLKKWCTAVFAESCKFLTLLGGIAQWIEEKVKEKQKARLCFKKI